MSANQGGSTMSANDQSGKSQIMIVGAGIAGLVAAITCAEEGAKVRLVEAHEQL
ncbi:MAG TPA: NAD(P)-binding protein, partial [Solirubrobacteraceae bacterium]|nr:NAD(P)-binding protein [Solirubrobacteraceae bacterium]